MSPLFVFAHHREAKFFLSQATPVKTHPTNLVNQPLDSQPLYYRGKGFHLCITGEGLENTLINTTKALSLLQAEGQLPSRVINLGVAGGIRQSLEPNIGSIVAINTAYGLEKVTSLKQQTSQISSTTPITPFFKSFNLQSPPISGHTTNLTDGVTLSNNLDHPTSELLKELSLHFPFAQAVDKELWWLALVCERFGIQKLSAYKIISDILVSHEINNKANNSDTLKNQIRSQTHLFEKINQLGETLLETKPSTNEYHQTTKQPWEESNDFYFTTSQRKNLDQIINTIKQHHKKDNSNSFLEIIKWKTFIQNLSSELSSKEKGLRFIAHLKLQLPLSNNFQDRLNQKIKLLTKNCEKKYPIEINHDPKLEAKKISLTLKIASPQEWEEQLKSLSQLSKEPDFQTLFDFYMGKNNIEE